MTLSGEIHVCSTGETFDSVALVEYGDEKFAAELLNANPSLCGTPIFSGGEKLLLPVVEVLDGGDGTGEDTYMPARAPWKE